MAGLFLGQGRRVYPFYVRSGLVWEQAELAAALRVWQAMAPADGFPLRVFDVPVVDLYQQHWSVTGADTPDAQSRAEEVYLPGRNVLLLTKVAMWCRMHRVSELAVGVLDTNPFGDASDDFFALFERLMNLYPGDSLRILRPLTGQSKSELMRRAGALPLGDTFSCIAPVGGLHCGRCNKCAERRQAFQEAQLPDPTEYAH